ncbi:helix-turn-helix domain-containing protein [Bradyrhizobium jicamae]|uniref:helix-turn-helix domain-containing protein n=1 Tax=Bradyrhizobium jicamae TaxID=280332 RepID=UPI001BA77975|nr:AraC family transcriptional regulator [Bradyrhizobium jicamae]MBR0935288.1 helix-turn-helix transcriptional regulator [Bradyrhizobium jicamae]
MKLLLRPTGEHEIQRQARRSLHMQTYMDYGSAKFHLLYPQIRSQVHHSSRGLGWNSITASSQRTEPFEEASFPPARKLFLVLHLTDQTRIERRLESRWTQKQLPSGAVSLVPAGCAVDVRLHHTHEFVVASLSSSILEEVAVDLIKHDPSRLEFIPEFGAIDPVLQRQVQYLHRLIANRSEGLKQSNTLHGETIAALIAAQLIQAHSATDKLPDRSSREGLPRRNLNRVEEYMQTHMGRKIQLRDLARLCNLSVSQLIRQFRVATGVTPHQYLMRIRIERVRTLLARGGIPISEIALDCGFCGQEHLTTAFRRFFGVTPRAFARTELSINRDRD